MPLNAQVNHIRVSTIWIAQNLHCMNYQEFGTRLLAKSCELSKFSRENVTRKFNIYANIRDCEYREFRENSLLRIFEFFQSFRNNVFLRSSQVNVCVFMRIFYLWFINSPHVYVKLVFFFFFLLAEDANCVSSVSHFSPNLFSRTNEFTLHLHT